MSSLLIEGEPMELNFHQTFKPERSYISELLQVGEEINRVSLEELSKMTGIPQGKSSGKLVPHLKYAKLMGLLDYSLSNGLYTAHLTDLGKELSEQDISLSENISILTLHHNIIKKESGADLWCYCFNDFFNRYGKKGQYSTFLRDTESKFGKIKYGPFLKSYEEFFSQLNLLEIDTSKDIIEYPKMAISQELLPVIGYIFYDLWDIIFPMETEITSTQLKNLNFRNRFNWNEMDELDALEQLSDYGLIRLNKQLMPFTILRLTSKDNLLSRLYSELL